MRVKAFTAKTMTAALRAVKREMGEDAIILSTWQRKHGVEVRAAIEPERMTSAETREHMAAQQVFNDTLLSQQAYAAPTPSIPPEATPEPSGLFTSRLRDKAFPIELVRTLCAGDISDYQTAVEAVEQHFAFCPLTRPYPPLVLLGTSGVGKTTVLAKLAARHVMRREQPHLVLADAGRAGASAQIHNHAEVMDARLSLCDDLLSAREALFSQPGPSLIEAPSIDPLSMAPFGDVKTLTEQNLIRPVLVLPAAGQPDDLDEICAHAVANGVHHTIITRCDQSQRLGATLAQVAKHKLHIMAFCHSPYIARGLVSADAGSLVRLILAEEAPGQALVPAEKPDKKPVRKPTAQPSGPAPTALHATMSSEDLATPPTGPQPAPHTPEFMDAEDIPLPQSSHQSSHRPSRIEIPTSPREATHQHEPEDEAMIIDLFGDAA